MPSEKHASAPPKMNQLRVKANSIKKKLEKAKHSHDEARRITFRPYSM
jgi:hypothetical protein